MSPECYDWCETCRRETTQKFNVTNDGQGSEIFTCRCEDCGNNTYEETYPERLPIDKTKILVIRFGDKQD